MKEVWKDICGYEGFYQVSDLGRVRSLDRKIPNSVGSGFRTMRGKILSSSGIMTGNGYPQVGLSKKGRVKAFDVHVLVLTTFAGPCPVDMECRHLDGDYANCTLSNLKWGTPLENQADRSSHGTSNAGVRSHFAKLTDDQVLEIRRRYRVGEKNQAKMAREYGISQSVVCEIVGGKIWRHLL